ncbi:MAG: NAD-glutamate dehydrogenase [Methylobacter sp.]|nr:NAD-glutamate dehydrogenase [Methylobacter sp.]
MKIILTTDEHEVKETRQRQTHTTVAFLLDTHENLQKRRFLKKLAESLLLTDSYLISFPATFLATLIVKILDFIEERPEAVAIQTIPLFYGNSRLLLVNCQNVPYIVDTILALQSKLNIRFQLLADSVLSIRRQNHEIVYLESDVSAKENELLIIGRLEFVDERGISLLTQEISQAIAAALKIDHNRLEINGKLNELKQADNLAKYSAYIDWLKNDAFILMEYQSVSSELPDQENSNLIRNAIINIDPGASDEASLLPNLKKILSRQTTVIVQNIPVISPIIRSQPLVYIGFRQQKESGSWIEHGFIGLFDEVELNGAAGNITELGKKINQTLGSIKVSRNSHEYFQLKEIFNLFPKIEFFLFDEAQLQLIAQSLKRYLHRSKGIKLLILTSTSPDRISALIIVPQAFYKEELERVLQDFLSRELSCRLETSRKIIPGGNYVGFQWVLIPEKEAITINVYRLDGQLNRLARPWDISFQQLIERALGKQEGERLWQKYYAAFPAEYKTLISPRYAIKDILNLEKIISPSTQCISLLKPYRHEAFYRLHFYSERERFLDEYIPVLENMHLRVMDQVQFPIAVRGGMRFIKSFTITAKKQCASFTELKGRMLEAMQVILDGKVENDTLNKLLVLTGMDWKQIDVLRAYRNYYLQLAHRTTRGSVDHALINNPKVALGLSDYFEARFMPNPDWDDPMIREEQALSPLRLRLLEDIASVTDINNDRILRTLFNLIDATMRSNFYQRCSLPDYFIAIKINSLGVIDMPAPKPQNEIYVHAAGMEGIHLRAGKIARGGIRWSDRSDDFRTEILGLMQTQISKNALIIPTGAKGGFVVKKNGSKIDFKEAGRKAYITLIQGLLDLTDNYIGEKVAPVPGLVTYDDPDPYLVVAADKGTAQLSDIANAVSKDYRFWLNDAFASGGSKGYDHKALGITARGAWECVKRHFRETGKDIQSEAFTVIGIGSMDGDVFGNGMLLSPYIRLLAAFSGQHIFIDPNPPDNDAPFNERKRLFELPGSSWNDYDRMLISEGGGIYHRSAKDIRVSPELKKWLGIRYKSLDGESLIRYLLTAPVELLWLGGIGTYVKATVEKHEEVGDRSNDAVRVNAADLNARVVGEGANLGFTQKARIEYSLLGGRINTDAVDNSAGVDTSDHEVNLKIFLTGLHKKNIITDYQPLFISMTQEVCRLVLANNYAQSLCLSLDQRRASGNSADFLQIAERLETVGFLDRAVESFPAAKEILGRPGQAITRPELAVLMSSGKMYLTQQIQESIGLLQEDYWDYYLQAYFPEQISKPYKDHLAGHPLAKEIKATIVSNKIINQAGCGFLAPDLTGENINTPAHVTCYLTFDRVLDGNNLRHAIYALDNKIAAEKQYQLLLQIEKMLDSFCSWTLLHGKIIQPHVRTINCYNRYLKDYEAYFKEHLNTEAGHLSEQMDQYRKDGLPDELAQKMVLISSLNDFPLLVSLSAETGRDFITILKLFNEITPYLGLDNITEQLAQLPVHDHWERKVAADLQEDIKRMVEIMIKNILSSKVLSCAEYFELPAEKLKITHYEHIYKEINNVLPVNLAPYIVLTKELEKLAGSTADRVSIALSPASLKYLGIR